MGARLVLVCFIFFNKINNASVEEPARLLSSSAMRSLAKQGGRRKTARPRVLVQTLCNCAAFPSAGLFWINRLSLNALQYSPCGFTQTEALVVVHTSRKSARVSVCISETYVRCNCKGKVVKFPESNHSTTKYKHWSSTTRGQFVPFSFRTHTQISSLSTFILYP